MTGIYKITNLINNKIYIGQSIDIEKRWEEHKYYSSDEHTAIQSAFKKYGISNFSFEVIEKCSKNKLDEREIYWIAYYDSYNNGYNLTAGGQTKRRLDYALIANTYLQLKSIHATSKQLNVHRDSVRKALEYFDISYNKTRSAPQSICMIDMKTGEELQVFPSIKDAALFLKISDSTIRAHLSGRLKSAGGYYWKKI